MVGCSSENGRSVFGWFRRAWCREKAVSSASHGGRKFTGFPARPAAASSLASQQIVGLSGELHVRTQPASSSSEPAAWAMPLPGCSSMPPTAEGPPGWRGRGCCFSVRSCPQKQTFYKNKSGSSASAR